jgi:4-amino-4-deoxy-L-arabinose transferase-like glycosyltransferase
MYHDLGYNIFLEAKHKMQKITKIVKLAFIPLVLGTMIFLSLAHHAFNYWELPALSMFLLFLILVPIIVCGLFILGNWLRPHIFQISKPKLILYLAESLLISLFITWLGFRVPASYQTITITPNLSSSQVIGMLELKAGRGLIPFQTVALQSNWQETNGIWYAQHHSRPMTVIFKCEANAPIRLLFEATPQSGSVKISLKYTAKQLDLSQTNTNITVVQFTSRYRGIPNGIFIPALMLLDIITFGTLILLLLVLQELGQIFTARPVMDNTSPPAFDLGLLLGLGLLLHLLNILSVPLILDADSTAFLQGAEHLLKYGNLDGVSKLVGPGTTFLFTPILFLFGRNAWGMKIFLHLIALACIPLCYWLGWFFSRNRWVAILSALIAVFNPDLFLYSNLVMSDLPNIFLVILFCAMLLTTIESLKPRWIMAAMLVGSFATLLRTENMLLIIIGSIALTAASLWRWLQDHSQDLKKPLIYISLSIVLAALPILWWSEHNQKVNGFFGMSNYMGVVLYDGWVFFGDASRMSFSDPNSIAVKKIDEAVKQYPIEPTDKSGIATADETLPALTQSGYTTEQAIGLLKSAALDSIRKNPSLTVQLLLLKLKTGLHPEFTYDITYSLPGEPAWASPGKLIFFDAENLSITPLIQLQKIINEKVSLWYPRLYPIWSLFCVLTLALSLFRQPIIGWMAVVAIVASRIFIPLTMSVPFWRYTASGWMLLQLIAISWIWMFINGIRSLRKPEKVVP